MINRSKRTDLPVSCSIVNNGATDVTDEFVEKFLNTFSVKCANFLSIVRLVILFKAKKKENKNVLIDYNEKRQKTSIKYKTNHKR